LKVEGSTLNVQLSTFNTPTFNLQHANFQPYNVQPSTLNTLTFNAQRVTSGRKTRLAPSSGVGVPVGVGVGVPVGVGVGVPVGVGVLAATNGTSKIALTLFRSATWSPSGTSDSYTSPLKSVWVSATRMTL
jgi:hypothetical protein